MFTLGGPDGSFPAHPFPRSPPTPAHYHMPLPTPGAMFFLEALAVVLNVAYALYMAYERRTGWIFGFFASTISVGFYLLARTWAMSALNGYYVVMAVYGWWSWGKGGGEVKISTLRWAFHVAVVPAGLVLSYGASVLLGQYLNGNFPGLDAFVTVSSFIGTWMMARKYLACWVYFLVADSAGIWLNWQIGYQGYALLNAVYLVLSVVGLVKWNRLRDRRPVGEA